MAANRETILLKNLRELSVACSEELEVNQWMVPNIPTLRSQSERAKKHYPMF